MSKLSTLDEPPDRVYEFVLSLIMWIVDCCAVAGGIVVMAVAAITIAVIIAMASILAIVIPSPRVHNTFKHMV